MSDDLVVQMNADEWARMATRLQKAEAERDGLRKTMHECTMRADRRKAEISAERDTALKKYEELSRAIFATGLDTSGRTPLEMVTRLADELRALRDPVGRVQREGSISYADLLGIREKYGALYAAVFPLVPALLQGIAANQGVSDAATHVADRLRAQIEVCK